ncbi:MAG: exodeoxyribonuclease VII large subunit [Armatimonadetes bacterium]|nr:exodeoxyribonuclease VII large subunit [Armatimonadota bacterium]
MLQPQALSVTELTTYLKRLLERDEVLADVTVRGEISNFTRHSSGHLYFSLKDDNCTLSCVCFRNIASRVRFDLSDGLRILAEGNISVYEKQGRYQLLVRAMRPDGVGDLAAAFEALKAKLEQEGLFAPERKRPLPRFPRGIGLITSPTGAAIRDLVSIISRRYPLARIVVVPTVVQGEAGAASIVASLKRANAREDLDVLIVGRGGGSLEDLWCFNEEAVARAVFASRLPVISAVGHETDTALTDFVADLRAATPSAAAELVVPDGGELARHLQAVGRHLQGRLLHHVQRDRQRLQRLLAHPVLQRPEALIEARAQRLARAAVGLDALSPHAVLGRGYSITRVAATGAIVRSVEQVHSSDELSITVSDGDIDAQAQ